MNVLVRKLKGLMFGKKAVSTGWTGDYNSWQEVLSECSGYDSKIILEKVKQSTEKVKNGAAAFERDSVAFQKFDFNENITNCLSLVAGKNNSLVVIDFGGSLGSLYFQYKRFLKSLNQLQWHVVEQKHFVDCGNQFIAEDGLKFFYSLDDAIEYKKPDLLILSSVICYLEEPYNWIKKFISTGIPYILIDRTAFISGRSERLTLQRVPPEIYPASYPAWFLNENKLLSAFEGAYQLLKEIPNKYDPEEFLDGKRCYRKGFFFKSKNEA